MPYPATLPRSPGAYLPVPGAEVWESFLSLPEMGVFTPVLALVEPRATVLCNHKGTLHCVVHVLALWNGVTWRPGSSL